jgi:hypothetical protein
MMVVEGGDGGGGGGDDDEVVGGGGCEEGQGKEWNTFPRKKKSQVKKQAKTCNTCQGEEWIASIRVRLV